MLLMRIEKNALRVCNTDTDRIQGDLDDAELDEVINRAFGGADPDEVGSVQYAFCYIKAIILSFLYGCKKGFINGWKNGKARYEERLENEQRRENECRKAGSDLFIISGPSGCGKDSVIEKVLDNIENAACAISCTTREPRTKKNGEKERHGVDYFFIDRKTFENKETDGDFLESAAVHNGDLYGTPYEHVKMLRLNGKHPIILNIDPQGAMQVKEQYSAATTIFLLPPSAQELRRRLEERASETPEKISQRMCDATKQIEYAYDYDYIVLNDTIEQAAKRILHIIEAQNYQSFRQEELIERVCREFAISYEDE